MRFAGELPCSVEAKSADVGGLPMTFVGTARLAELGLVARHVEYVVDDLENHAELRRKAAVGDCGRSAQAGHDQHAADGRGDESAGLQLVEAAQLGLARSAHVQVLAA